MIVFLTFFKYKEGKGINYELKEPAERNAKAVKEKLIATGKMKFRYFPLLYGGPELNGRKDWDAVTLYAVDDMEGCRAWFDLPEHKAMDAAWKENGSIEDCFGFQLSDDSGQLKEIMKYMVEVVAADTDRYPNVGPSKFNRF